MALETGNYINDLVITNPTSTDPKSQGDDHIRLVKATIKATFPNINGVVTTSPDELNYMVGATIQPAMKDGSNLTTPTLGDSSLKIATTAFVAATSFASVLPAQTGNSGKFITTNGSVARWDSAGCVVAPATGGTLPGNVMSSLLTNATYTLPDLTTCNDAIGFMAISSSASVPTTISTSDGWAITTGMTAGTVRVLQPASRFTAHGTWGSSAMSPPMLATVTVAAAPTIIGTVMMPNSILLVAYTVSNIISVVALDTINNIAGTSVVVSSTAYANTFTIHKDTATTFVCHYNSTSGFCIAGSLASTAITLGTETAFTTALNLPPVQLQAGSYISAVLGPQTAVVSVTGIACTVSLWSSGPYYQYGLIRISNTTALLCGRDVATGLAQAQVLTVAGSTITLGTLASSATAINGAITGGVIAFDATNFLFFIGNATPTSTLNFYNIAVSGTTCTFGAVAQLTSTAPTAYTPTTYDYNPYLPAWTYSATQILFALAPAIGLIVISRSGSTLTIGTQQLSQTYTATNTFFQDYAKTTLYYGDNVTKFDRITAVTGTTITSAEQIASASTLALSTTITNKVVKYGATWYVWNVAFKMPVSATKVINVAANTITLNGAIS